MIFSANFSLLLSCPQTSANLMFFDNFGNSKAFKTVLTKIRATNLQKGAKMGII